MTASRCRCEASPRPRRGLARASRGSREARARLAAISLCLRSPLAPISPRSRPALAATTRGSRPGFGEAVADRRELAPSARPSRATRSNRRAGEACHSSSRPPFRQHWSPLVRCSSRPLLAHPSACRRAGQREGRCPSRAGQNSGPPASARRHFDLDDRRAGSSSPPPRWPTLGGRQKGGAGVAGCERLLQIDPGYCWPSPLSGVSKPRLARRGESWRVLAL